MKNLHLKVVVFLFFFYIKWIRQTTSCGGNVKVQNVMTFSLLVNIERTALKRNINVCES